MKRFEAMIVGCTGWVVVSALWCHGAAYTVRPDDILIANYNAGSVVKIDASDGSLERLGGVFTVPTDLVLDGQSGVYICELPGTIKRLDFETGEVATVMPVGSGPSQLWGITQGTSGDLFVTSRGDHGVYRVHPDTGMATLVTRSNLLVTPVAVDVLDPDHLVVSCLSVDRLVAVSLLDHSQSVILEGGGLDQPWGVAVSGADIFVGAYDGKLLQRFTGNQLEPVATMNDFPYGLGVDTAGNVVVGLQGVGQSVVRIDPDGTPLNTYTGGLISWVTGLDVAREEPPLDPDTDEDGMTDGEEDVAGTDPLDPTSVLWLGAGVQEGGGQLVWPSVAGRIYSVYESIQCSGAYTPVATELPATPPTNSWRLSERPEAQRYFRIEVQRLP